MSIPKSTNLIILIRIRSPISIGYSYDISCYLATTEKSSRPKLRLFVGTHTHDLKHTVVRPSGAEIEIRAAKWTGGSEFSILQANFIGRDHK
jgi:hypothetical protein